MGNLESFSNITDVIEGKTERVSLMYAELRECNGCYLDDSCNICRTDDNGQTYEVNGELLPNTTYIINESKYETSETGQIISCEARPKIAPETPRDTDAQMQAGGEDRKMGDQGGHIVAKQLGGAGGAGNLVAMDSRINQSDWLRMENDVKFALKKDVDVSGKETDVKVKSEFSYTGDSKRPDVITVTVTDGEQKSIYTFDNNIDGALTEKIDVNHTAVVQSKINDTGGKISSVKEEYDGNDKLTRTEITITYSDEGKNRRTKVFIEN